LTALSSHPADLEIIIIKRSLNQVSSAAIPERSPVAHPSPLPLIKSRTFMRKDFTAVQKE
jgi:hypothetical protein